MPESKRPPQSYDSHSGPPHGSRCVHGSFYEYGSEGPVIHSDSESSCSETNPMGFHEEPEFDDNGPDNDADDIPMSDNDWDDEDDGFGIAFCDLDDPSQLEESIIPEMHWMDEPPELEEPYWPDISSAPDESPIAPPSEKTPGPGSQPYATPAVSRRQHPPSDDPDPWSDHPAGCQGAWLRERAEASWNILKKITGRDMFNPPRKTTPTDSRNVNSDNKAARKMQQDMEFCDEMASSLPPAAPRKAFAGQIPGYIFTTRNNSTSYYSDTASPTETNTSDSAQSPPPEEPTTISLDAHISDKRPPASSQLATPRRVRCRNRRRRFIGPLPPVPPTTIAADDSWHGNGLMAFDTANGNCFASTEYLRRTSAADAILIQETKTLEGRTDSLKANAKVDGWRTITTAANPGRGNTASGGTAVLVRSCFGLRVAPGSELIGEPHRSCMGQATLLDGLYVTSAYLRHSEGASPENLAILGEIAANLATTDGRWLLGMDANMSPQELTETGWLELVDGKIHHANAPTCGNNNYDYFVASKAVSRSIHGVQVVTDAGMNPHSAVRVLIKAGDVRRRRRILARPPKIPGVMPLGPPEETILNWQQLDVQPNLPTQAPPEQQTRRRRSYNRRSEIPMPTDDTQRSINDLSDDFVKESRRFWSAILGRDVGDDDRASFQWKSQLRSPRNPDSENGGPLEVHGKNTC